jgi:hypothetical protein
MRLNGPAEEAGVAEDQDGQDARQLTCRQSRRCASRDARASRYVLSTRRCLHNLCRQRARGDIAACHDHGTFTEPRHVRRDRHDIRVAFRSTPSSRSRDLHADRSGGEGGGRQPAAWAQVG